MVILKYKKELFAKKNGKRTNTGKTLRKSYGMMLYADFLSSVKQGIKQETRSAGYGEKNGDNVGKGRRG